MARYATPLRYPGGKQRLTPFVEEILRANDGVGWNYVEPYAGGAGVAMELLCSGVVKHVFLNDSSRHIYAFWRTILTDPDSFCSRISRASLSITAWKRHRDVVQHPRSHSLADLGFSTFYLNRCNRSGILNAGVIGGLSQMGEWRMDARFPRNELIRRVEAIAARSHQISVTNDDAENFMVERVNQLPRETLVYCDPPYYQRAERLYLNVYEEGDHSRLASVIQGKLRRPWIVSYDAHPAIIGFYRDRRRFRYSLQYSAIRAYAGTEVFVFADGLRLPRTSRVPYLAKGVASLPRSA